MVAYFTTPVRTLLLALALTFAGQMAVASEPAPTATARTTARARADAAHPDEPPLDGVLLIAGLVGAIILLAWVCSRIGDNRSHVIH